MKLKTLRSPCGVLLSVVALASFLLVVFAVYSPLSHAAVPSTMNFQGRLLDPAGSPRADGLYNMQFRIYTASSGGTPVWSETREAASRVQVTGGLFSTQLGQVTPLPASIFSNTNLYFEIVMATPATATCSTAACATWESPMSPRHALAASAYAYNADTLDGQDSNAFAPSTGSANYIQNQSGTAQSGSFRISGTGRMDTALQAPTIDAPTATTLNIGKNNASAVSIGKSGGAITLSSLTTAGVVTTNASGQLSSTATLGIANGGTNTSSIGTAGSIAYSTGSAYGFSAAGSSGQCLQSAGANAPTWGSCGSTYTIGTINGTTKSVNGAAISGNTIYMQTADTSRPGLISTGSQTFAGDKVFRSTTNSTNAFEIQNSSSTALLRADTTTNTLHMGSLVNIQGSAADSLALQVTGNTVMKAETSGTGPTTLFSDGFESNNLTNWSSATAGRVSVVTSPVKTGTYSARITSAYQAATLRKAISPVTGTISLSADVYVSSATTSTPLLTMSSSAGGIYVFRKSSGGFTVYNTITDSGVDSTSTGLISTGVWYNVELILTTGVSGDITVKLNGDTVSGLSGVVMNTGTAGIDNVQTGDGSTSYNYTSYIDNFSATIPSTTTRTGGTLTVEGALTINAPSTYSQRVCHNQSDGATTNMTLGDCISGGADVAEYYKVAGLAEPGDIVAADPAGDMAVTPSTSPYQRTMMGIISTNPEVDGILGQSLKDSSRQPVALAGRVPLKLSLENGPIAPGDPLTASSTPGVAMKATRPGRIIGIALEKYTTDSPRVSTQVKLQEAERNILHKTELQNYQSNPSLWPDGVGKIMVMANLSYYDATDLLQATAGSTSNLQAANATTALQTTASGGAVSGNLSVTGDLNVSGVATMQALKVTTAYVTNLLIDGHIVTGGGTPTLKATDACKLDNLSITGTDTAGTIRFTAKEDCMTDQAVLSMSFAEAYGEVPNMIIGAKTKEAQIVDAYSTETKQGSELKVANKLNSNVEYAYSYYAVQ